MKNIFTTIIIICIGLSSFAQDEIGAPYNPDSNSDSLINVTDLLQIFPLFGQPFLPSDDDLDNENEIQSLYISNDTLYLIPNGGFILLEDLGQGGPGDGDGDGGVEEIDSLEELLPEICDGWQWVFSDVSESDILRYVGPYDGGMICVLDDGSLVNFSGVNTTEVLFESAFGSDPVPGPANFYSEMYESKIYLFNSGSGVHVLDLATLDYEFLEANIGVISPPFSPSSLVAPSSNESWNDALEFSYPWAVTYSGNGTVDVAIINLEEMSVIYRPELLYGVINTSNAVFFLNPNASTNSGIKPRMTFHDDKAFVLRLGGQDDFDLTVVDLTSGEVVEQVNLDQGLAQGWEPGDNDVVSCARNDTLATFSIGYSSGEPFTVVNLYNLDNFDLLDSYSLKFLGNYDPNPVYYPFITTHAQQSTLTWGHHDGTVIQVEGEGIFQVSGPPNRIEFSPFDKTWTSLGCNYKPGQARQGAYTLFHHTISLPLDLMYCFDGAVNAWVVPIN